MSDVAWGIFAFVMGLGGLAFGISIGRTLGYCDRLIEEIDERMDHLETRLPRFMNEES